ncbi:hypothetical protein CC77DRAFT_27384 [Alternaria alternata]|jgi:hypothetical protein|uniref:Secreted protein n=1 Tax=Alternaria alternata TaxID=5599 RepID=A0A177E2G1_ALTAL|nr:hypothetical protein CC77DRAFT_27384 [Alternaria alternata]KAH6852229.1 hypothetical protein B0T12DRAFT_178833 [Alternaria alternata]OAG26144.1 hypothetical protein CC77DRAFT_27384 [Alternaria alternata]
MLRSQITDRQALDQAESAAALLSALLFFLSCSAQHSCYVEETAVGFFEAFNQRPQPFFRSVGISRFVRCMKEENTIISSCWIKNVVRASPLC